MSGYCQSFLKLFFNFALLYACPARFPLRPRVLPALGICCHNIVILISERKLFKVNLVPNLVFFALYLDKILCL